MTSEQFLFKFNQIIIKELKTTTWVKHLSDKLVKLWFTIFFCIKKFSLGILLSQSFCEPRSAYNYTILLTFFQMCFDTIARVI